MDFFLCSLCLFLASAAAEPVTCLPLTKLSRELPDIPLTRIDAYLSADGNRAGTIELLDWRTDPVTFNFSPAGNTRLDFNQLCVLRADLEDRMVFRLRTIEHDYDGLACISFDEGTAHRQLFQRLPHNQATEIQLEAFWQLDNRWHRLPLQSGFPREAFLFKCGVRVGEDVLIELVERGQLRDGDILLTEEGLFAGAESFQQDGEIEVLGRTYRRGRGIPIP